MRTSISPGCSSVRLSPFPTRDFLREIISLSDSPLRTADPRNRSKCCGLLSQHWNILYEICTSHFEKILENPKIFKKPASPQQSPACRHPSDRISLADPTVVRGNYKQFPTAEIHLQLSRCRKCFHTRPTP